MGIKLIAVGIIALMVEYVAVSLGMGYGILLTFNRGIYLRDGGILP